MSFLSAIVLLGIAALSAIGFMASFEPVPGALVWRYGYGFVTVACLAAAVLLLRGDRDETR